MRRSRGKRRVDRDRATLLREGEVCLGGGGAVQIQPVAAGKTLAQAAERKKQRPDREFCSGSKDPCSSGKGGGHQTGTLWGGEGRKRGRVLDLIRLRKTTRT